jgi:hypothetical protein
MNRAEELWAWITEYPDGSAGLIGSMVPGMPGITPLITRGEEAIRQLEPLARLHGKVAGQRVWLRKYRMVEDFE